MFDHPILPTTIVGSYPQPDWLIDRERLKASLPPRVRAETLWRVPEPWLADAQEAATLMAIRDQEELGIDTWASCLAPLTFASHSYADFHLLMPLFACRKWDGIPSSRENQKLAWVKPADLRSYPMPAADVPLIPILRDWL